VQENYDEQHQIIRYLLGHLSASDEAALVRRRAESAGFDEWCQAIEEELIDDFVQNRLSREDAALFQRKYLISADRSLKVAFADAMLHSFNAPPSARPARVLRIVAIAATVFLAIAGALFFFKQSRVVVASYTLVPGAVRALEPAQELRIPSSAVLLKLVARPDAGLSADHAALRPVGAEDPILRQTVVPGPRDTVEVLVPAASLSNGDYLLILQAGEESVASRYFRIAKQ
jgi:hypothetical protein